MSMLSTLLPPSSPSSKCSDLGQGYDVPGIMIWLWILPAGFVAMVVTCIQGVNEIYQSKMHKKCFHPDLFFLIAF
jgi:hypothetical protein